MGAIEDKLSVPDLLRRYLINALTSGAAIGSNVYVTNTQPGLAGGVLPTAPTDTRFLTERMFAKAPQSGYSLWLDTADITNIYIAEAVSSETAGTATTFQGIRVQKDANGNPYGKVQIATAFAWNSRTTAGWA